jgi:hypothetical protein
MPSASRLRLKKRKHALTAKKQKLERLLKMLRRRAEHMEAAWLAQLCKNASAS